MLQENTYPHSITTPGGTGEVLNGKGRVLLRGGGGWVQGGWVGGAVGGTPPPSGDPELLEAPKKIFGLN